MSRLDREQSAMVKGGADTTVIQQTKVCALTKQCETARCVSATGCESDNVTACVEVSKKWPYDFTRRKLYSIRMCVFGNCERNM